MPNPTILEEAPLCLVDVKEAMDKIVGRDEELGVLSQKTKEYLDNFVTLTVKQRDDIKTGLKSLDLTRLKAEHIAKIIDFLPQNLDDLKVVMLGYNVTLPKKDQEAIIDEVKKVI
ncbi:hypothetical protein HOC01_00050 [archaeon]|jgi:DNA-directed RNA polymerase subunit F|nr:hypothetical protein [archaeon]MBT6698768.1 hypothetical protein [archaeon]